MARFNAITRSRVRLVVFDPKAPSSRSALEELAKVGVRMKLLLIARKQTRSDADAEDLIANALVLVCDADRAPWDPTAGAFIRHMAHVMRKRAIEDARTWSARKVVVDSALVDGAPVPDGAPLADEAIAGQESQVRLQRLAAALRARVAGDARALEVLDCAGQGFEGPADQAAQLGCPIAEIREARRRLKHHGARLLAEEEEAAKNPGGRKMRQNQRTAREEGAR